MSHELPKLGYRFDALEPYIDARTMKIHYSGHHAGYVQKLNRTLADYPALRVVEIDELLASLETLPDVIRTSVRNNGGGHANHSLFWTILGPDGGGEPEGELSAEIKAAFGSFEQFQKRFTASALNRFGSGWAWLSLDHNDKLMIENTPNQDSPLMYGRRPVLGLDLWEHAYYLLYQNRRADYVAAWWNTVRWDQVARWYAGEKWWTESLAYA
jgi:superoxide dismutase, Fe-Mn family